MSTTLQGTEGKRAAHWGTRRVAWDGGAYQRRLPGGGDVKAGRASQAVKGGKDTQVEGAAEAEL